MKVRNVSLFSVLNKYYHEKHFHINNTRYIIFNYLWEFDVKWKNSKFSCNSVVKNFINPYSANTFATSMEPGQLAHPCSLNRLYTVGCPTLRFHLYIPKMIMESAKNVRWIIPFKKFGMVRVIVYSYNVMVWKINFFVAIYNEILVHVHVYVAWHNRKKQLYF